jgi:type IV secretory pathway TrbD component
MIASVLSPCPFRRCPFRRHGLVGPPRSDAVVSGLLAQAVMCVSLLSFLSADLYHLRWFLATRTCKCGWRGRRGRAQPPRAACSAR